MLVITSDQQSQALASMDSELRHLLEEHHIGTEVIAVISHLHAKTLLTFSKIEADEANVRDWIINDVGIERAGAGRGIISTLVAVWEMAKQRVAAEGIIRAEARAEGRTPELPPQTVLNLRKDYQALVGVLPDEEYPSEAYLNMKMAQLECGVLKAEVLDEVTSKRMEEDEQNGGDEFEVDWSRRGMRLKRHKLHGTLPTSTEELPSKFDLIKHCYALLRLRHGGRQLLHGLRPETWDNYVRYLLGKDIWGAKVRDASGTVIAELRWDQLLHFDLEARKWAVKQVNETGAMLGEALKAVGTNNDLVVKYVTTALATANVRKPPVSAPSSVGTALALAQTMSRATPTKRQDRRLKAKRKLDELHAEVQRLSSKGSQPQNTQDKGKGKKGKGTKGNSTPGGDNNGKWLALARKHRKLKAIDGVRFCWSFNEGRGCRANCQFDHLCAFCGNPDHPIWNCRAFKELNLQ